MLPPATRAVADRLIMALVSLARAVAAIANAGGDPALPEHAAHRLFLRLGRLVVRLVRIGAVGLRAPAAAGPAPRPTGPATPRDPGRRHVPSLPRRPGWLLAALPGLAPAIAGDLRTLFADPAAVALLGAAPAFNRRFRPVLRSLGLDPSPPDPAPPPPSAGPRLPPPKPLVAPPRNAPPPPGRQPVPIFPRNPPVRQRVPTPISLR